MADQYGIWLHVERCDNDMRIMVDGVQNGQPIHTENNPLLHEYRLLRALPPSAGSMKVHIYCSNTNQAQGNPYNFKFQIERMKIVNGGPVGPVTQTFVNEHITSNDQNAPGYKWDKEYLINY